MPNACSSTPGRTPWADPGPSPAGGVAPETGRLAQAGGAVVAGINGTTARATSSSRPSVIQRE